MGIQVQKFCFQGLVIGSAVLALSGCRSPDSYRIEADDVAAKILDDAWLASMGRTEDGFTVEPASDSLRRRLMLDQLLPMSAPASASSSDDQLIEQWPDEGYFTQRRIGDLENESIQIEPPKLTLIDALHVAATNSIVYQRQKETVYQSALQLDIERDAFRNTWAGVMNSVLSTDLDSSPDATQIANQDSVSVSKRFKNGSRFMGMLAFDLTKLLTGSRNESSGVQLDTSLSIPLLRGSGEFVVTEPLTQAQRDVVYSIYGFERFKRSFAVSVASEYLSVLQSIDRVDNAVENYTRVVASTRRARRLADAGRLPEIQVDQSIQDELRARNAWVSALQSSEQTLDRFKMTLGLPTDAIIELDSQEFAVLLESERYAKYLSPVEKVQEDGVPSADTPVVLEIPSMEDAGPMEMVQEDAVLVALMNRLDLRVAVGQIVDAQRGVAIAADNLRADITLLGSASLGGSAGSSNNQIRTDRGFYSVLLGIDLPFERTAERNSYRNALISYEGTVRQLQGIEDSVKFEVRSVLRSLLEARESIKIQAESVRVAQRRVDSTNLFLQAGRAEIRDLLEAQNSLNSAQDALTDAVVNYRIGELQFQLNLGVLEVGSDGLWVEFDPNDYDIDLIREELDTNRPAMSEEVANATN
tara:strand:+ start:249616 stop:251544 length:1929 start_codon:yes stop_codon:yes gene_type:complete